MHKGGGDGSERKTVGECESSGEEEGTVLVIFVDVEGSIVIDDL